jgi:hypothetical protein
VSRPDRDPSSKGDLDAASEEHLALTAVGEKLGASSKVHISDAPVNAEQEVLTSAARDIADRSREWAVLPFKIGESLIAAVPSVDVERHDP